MSTPKLKPPSACEDSVSAKVQENVNDIEVTREASAKCGIETKSILGNMDLQIEWKPCEKRNGA